MIGAGSGPRRSPVRPVGPAIAGFLDRHPEFDRRWPPPAGPTLVETLRSRGVSSDDLQAAMAARGEVRGRTSVWRMCADGVCAADDVTLADALRWITQGPADVWFGAAPDLTWQLRPQLERVGIYSADDLCHALTAMEGVPARIGRTRASCARLMSIGGCLRRYRVRVAVLRELTGWTADALMRLPPADFSATPGRLYTPRRVRPLPGTRTPIRAPRPVNLLAHLHTAGSAEVVGR